MGRNQQGSMRAASVVWFVLSLYLLADRGAGAACAAPPSGLSPGGSDGWTSARPTAPALAPTGLRTDLPSAFAAPAPLPLVVRGAAPEPAPLLSGASLVLPPLRGPLWGNSLSGGGLVDGGTVPGTISALAAAPPTEGRAPPKGPSAAPQTQLSDAHAPYLPPDAKVLPIDLPYALRLVSPNNPTVALARERVRQAYAAQRQAAVAWLPNIWFGGNPTNITTLPMFAHHDGLLQNANGVVSFTDKNSFFIPGGTTLNTSVADAWFSPRIARRRTDAAAAQAQTVDNDVQLEVALAYLDLLGTYASLAINDESLRLLTILVKAAEGAESSGLGKPADANQARAEYELRLRERSDLQSQAALASARLAQLLLLDPTVDLVPADQSVLPINLVPSPCSLDELVALGLTNRPELAEGRALIAAALERWRQECWRPLLPTLQAVYYGGSFIGGNPDLRTAGGRDDVMAQAVWELRNAGLGNLFLARETRSLHTQANLHLVEVQARVAAEVTASAKMVRVREAQLEGAQRGVRESVEMWARLHGASFGVATEAAKFDPIQPFLAVRALRDARLAYLREVIEYDRQQFRLYWAMGQPPIHALDKAAARPVSVPLLPPAELPKR